MDWLLLISLGVLICFSGVLLFGAPYLPTLTPQIRAALELADLKPGDTLLELGCGDGRMLIAAARQGVKSVGYELNPLLLLIAWLRTRRYRQQVHLVAGDFWCKEWPPHQAIFVFLLPKYMEKLDKKIVQSSPKPVKLISFAFQIPGKRPVRKKAGVFLYRYQ